MQMCHSNVFMCCSPISFNALALPRIVNAGGCVIRITHWLEILPRFHSSVCEVFHGFNFYMRG